MSLKKYKEYNEYIIPYEDNSYIDFVVFSKDNNGTKTIFIYLD